jgi:hypothetical protein
LVRTGSDLILRKRHEKLELASRSISVNDLFSLATGVSYRPPVRMAVGEFCNQSDLLDVAAVYLGCVATDGVCWTRIFSRQFFETVFEAARRLTFP